MIHRTSSVVAVRSKSELLVFEALRNAGLQPEYEKALTLVGTTRYPVFTIDNEISGRTVYWEHLGMLEREEYRRSWEKKLDWYRANKVLPADEGGGENGMLVTTQESSSTGFNVADVLENIRKYLQ